MKKRLLVLCVLTLLLSYTSWASDFNVDGIYYNIVSSEDLTCAVTYYNATSSSSYGNPSHYKGSITIPETVEYSNKTYTVTGIGQQAFCYCSSITEVLIPSTITYIDTLAFYNCSRITEITIPRTVTSIGGSAFYGCSKLEEVEIPNGIDVIHYGTFYGCSALTKVTIPESVTSIWDSAFYSCSNLEELNLPESVTSIGSYAFSDCKGLTSVTIPNSVETIGDYAFQRCTGLTEITIPNSVETIGDYAFQRCTGLTEVTIPNNVTEIGSGAFRGCTGLMEVTIPNSVTEIEKSTFEGCSTLTEISIPESVIAIGENAFYECTELREVTIPINVTEIGNLAFYGCTGLTDITFNAAMCTSAGSSSNSSFYKCEEVERINIGEKVSEIPQYTFYDCTNIKKITSLNQTPPTIYSSSFGSEALEIEVPKESVFAYLEADICKNIPKLYATDNEGNEYYPAIIYYDGDAIVIASGGDENGAIIKNGSTVKITPTNVNEEISGFVQHRANDVTDILNKDGEYSFTISELYKENVINSCSVSPSNLYDITVEEAGDVLNKISVSNISSVNSLKITGDINGTDIQTIRRMTNLQMLDLSDANIVSGGVYYDDYTTSDNEIGKYFFYDMTSLKSVKLPTNVTSINNYAFGGCTNIISITIPQSVTSIDSYSFSGCTSLRNLAIEDGTEKLNMSTTSIAPFDDSPIETIYMGRTISYSSSSLYGTTHYYSPFSGNKNLVSVEIGNNVKTIYEDEFLSCTSLSCVTIGCNVKSIGSYAFSSCRKLAKLIIGSGVTEISSYAFQRCTGLTEVTIPESVTSIGLGAFYNCTGITEITIPNTVAEMYCNSFENCTKATKLTYEDGEEDLDIKFTATTATPIFTSCESLYLGRNLNYIKINNAVIYSPFEQATNLWSVTIGDKVTSLPSFSGCTGLVSINIPNSVVTIGGSIFYGCTSLSCVTIGCNVKSIGSSAFQGCSNLATINSANPTPPDIKSSTFSGVDKESCVLNIPIGSLNAYWVHVYWGEFFNIKEVDFPDGINNIVHNNRGGDIIDYYTLDGKKMPSEQPGINILRYSDGTTRKVLVK